MSPTCLARCAVPEVSTRMSVSTDSAVETVASGGVTSLGTSAGEDARSLTVRRAGEPTTGTYKYKVITLLLLYRCTTVIRFILPSEYPYDCTSARLSICRSVPLCDRYWGRWSISSPVSVRVQILFLCSYRYIF